MNPSLKHPEYMLLFRGNDWPKGLSPEEMQQVASQWMAWFNRLTDQGIALAGSPLEAEGKNDDAIRAIRLFAARIADACIDGKAMYEASLQEDVGEAPIAVETKPEEYPETAEEEAAAAPAEAETPEKEQQAAEPEAEGESESGDSGQYSARA